MRLLIQFARAYPLRSLLTLACLLLGLVAEGIQLSMLLPLLALVTGSGSAEPSALERAAQGLLAALRVEPSLGILILLFVGAMTLRSLLVLLAKALHLLRKKILGIR